MVRSTDITPFALDGHVYGAFNLAYGIGSARKSSPLESSRSLNDFALVGPLIGGQVS